MPEETRTEAAMVRFATGLFRHVEHFVYIVLGCLLSAAAIVSLGGAALELWTGLGNWARADAIFAIIDPLLFVLLLIEILHTIRASIRTGNLTPEPFLIVGLIASIRRILVITLQTSEVTKPGNWSAENQSILHGSMIELGVLGALVLVLVVSLYLLRRSNQLYGKAPDEQT